MRRLRHVAVVLPLLAVLAAPVPAAAGGLPETIPLPNGFAPEGIDADRDKTFYVGSLANGAIFSGDLRTGEGEILVEGQEGEVAVGVFYERRRHRLWVAGGDTGEVRVYDAGDGELLETYEFGGTGFLNDVVVTRDAAYVTDSMVQQLLVIPLGRRGALPEPLEATALPLTGDIEYVEGFNANGIVATRDGRHLVLVQSVTASLFRVDPDTGEAEQIELTGGDVTNGDGLELHGRTLWVVQNMSNQVAVVKLDKRLRSGEVVDVITDDDLDVPTTVVDAAGKLWAVNARFGVTPTPDTEYHVVRLPKRTADR